MVHCSLTENEHQNFQKMIDNNTHARLTAFQKLRYVASFFWAILLLFAQELFEVKIPSIVFATLISLPLWVLNKEKLPKYLCFLVPITFGVHGVLYLYILITLFVRYKVSSWIQIVPPLILAIVEWFDCTNSPTHVDLTKIIIFYSAVGVFFYLILDKTCDIKTSLKWLCIGLATGLFLLYARAFVMGDWTQMLEVNSRGDFDNTDLKTDTISHFIANANTIAFYSITLLSVIVCLWRQMGLKTSSMVLIATIAIGAGVFSYSRTWILCVALLILLFILLSKTKQRFYLSIILVGGFFYLSYTENVIFDAIFSGFSSRFEEASLDTGGHRTEIFAGYNEFFFSHPEYWFAGTGASCYNDVCKYWSSMHNGFQQLYICLGFIGLCLFSLLALSATRLRCANIKASQWIPIIIIFLFNQSVQFLAPICLMFPFILGAYSLRIEQSDKKK